MARVEVSERTDIDIILNTLKVFVDMQVAAPRQLAWDLGRIPDKSLLLSLTFFL